MLGSGCLNLNRFLVMLGSGCLCVMRFLCCGGSVNLTLDTPPAADVIIFSCGKSRTKAPNEVTLRKAALKPCFDRRTFAASAVVVFRPSSRNLAASISAKGCRLCVLAASMRALPPLAKSIVVVDSLVAGTASTSLLRCALLFSSTTLLPTWELTRCTSLL